jgi:tetratricopeptide (TPR) repeat protein
MRKLLILVLITSPAWCKSQNQRYDLHTDTLTYQYFLKGDWNTLIDSAQYALKRNIDFKFLRQRLGYAYYIKGEFYKSEYQYERALKFDPQDETTNNYLYYCGINTGNETYTRYRSGRLSMSNKKSFGIKPVKAISLVDCEYNVKYNDHNERGNPYYFRLGVGTQLGYHIDIYQAFSIYKQINKSNYVENSGSIPIQTTDSSSVKQAEYYISCNWNIAPHWQINMGYHYLNSALQTHSKYVYSIGTKKYSTSLDSAYNLPGHLFHTRISYDWKRLNLGLSGSVFNYYSRITQQYGAFAGVILPGKNYITLQTALYGMLNDQKMKKIIYSQSVGALFFKRLWVEGAVKLGNLDYFSDNNGLYIYNSLDPTTFRSGVSSFLKINKHISFFGNYTYDRKLIEDNNISYNQHSFSGGIIWKL